MQTLFRLIKWACLAFGGVLALVIVAALYGSMTPQADMYVKRAANERRAKQQAESDARNEAAQQAGAKMAEAVLAVDQERQNQTRVFNAGFEAGKRRAEAKKPMPDLSSINSLARDIIKSYGLESKKGELESQFRAGYGKGWLTGK